MSHNPDWDSIDLGENAYIVDIDPDSLEYGEQRSAGFRGNTAAQMYICHNWLSLKPTMGKPLRPGTTYAAILETGIKDVTGNALRQDPNFTAMLNPTGPGAGRAKATWNAYAPLRNWVTDRNVNTSRLAVAAVFTTQTFEVLPRLRKQVRSEVSPSLVGGAPTLDDSANNYTKFTGVITVPFYQNGTRPFAVSGGEVMFNASGAPVRVSFDNVPFALTVPKGDAPANGWPIFLYAHGTDGNETSFISNGVADNMATLGVAVISMLQVQHGIRRGIPDGVETDETQPSMLFYNFRNPYAAIGNNYQAAADYFQLVRLVESYHTITGQDIRFDVNKLYYFGHSQGTQGQYLAAVHDPLIKGIVLSGAGGYLTESLLGKKQPIDLSIAVGYLLMDPNVDDAHPVLSLIQASMEQVDPVNHSPAAFRNEWPGATYPGRDLYMAFGINDTYAPEATQKALARALGLHMDYVDGDHEIGGLQQIDEFPYAGSRTVDDIKITTVGIQYKPDGDYDGHYVLFQNEDAMTQLTHFVETMVADDTVAEVINP
ncbi:MAG: hypothetical protein JXX14_03435 [Deltaproteobacteria bacterium]|nr:hypothetical protein [Deltaproteobacteria bacterium]